MGHIQSSVRRRGAGKKYIWFKALIARPPPVSTGAACAILHHSWNFGGATLQELSAKGNPDTAIFETL